MAFAFAAVGFVVANAAISLSIVVAWRWLRRLELRSNTLFALRLVPAVGSAVLVLAVILPAFWSFEPRGTSERAGPALAAVVVAAGALIVAAARRAVRGWLDTRRVERAWTATGVKSTGLPFPVLVYRVPGNTPLAALIGSLRPRLFLSGPFIEGLLAGERQAVLDHEAAHLRNLDNLKRTAMRLAPDWLSLGATGREIESAWAVAAEEEADDHAAAGDRARSLDLAGALIKASRLAPVRCAAASGFCEETAVVRRVARLLADRPARRVRSARRTPRLVLAVALVCTTAVLAGPALRAAYTVTESAVRLLDYGAW
jgi:beta-lactamase regulating signal transducer with metallopeptidase domain